MPFGNLINGREQHVDRTFESLNSSKLSDAIGAFPESDEEAVRAAAEAARAAQPKWASLPAPVRGQIVGQIGAAIRREKESLSRLVTREMGKTLKEARGEVQEAIDTYEFF